METWEWIPEWEGLYKASTHGRIKSYSRKNPFIMVPLYNPNGYVRVDLCHNKIRKSSLIHRLIAQTFIPNPFNKKEVNHKNGIPDDNRVENLEWVTKEENEQHSWRKLNKKCAYGMLGKKGELNSKSKKIAQINPETKEIMNVFFGTNEAFRQTGISQGNIGMVARGERSLAGGFIWKYI